MSLSQIKGNTCLMLCFLCLSTPSVSEILEASTAHWSPYAMEDSEGNLKGISVDILNELMIKTGHEAIITLQPISRLNQLFDEHKIDLNFADSPKWNPQQPEDIAFTDPYTIVYEYIYFLKPNFIEVTKPSDLSGKFIGITRGYYYGSYQSLFKNKIIDRHEAYSNKNLLTLLVKKRVDAAFFDDLLFNFLIKAEHMDRVKFKRGAKLSEAPLSIKLNKNKFYLLEELNTAIADMKEEGRIQRIINSYVK
ncbi:transporter substrate-binding domain-containing protein [Litoribacillus peritrichatus]